jgi:hypothetical protein
MHEGIYVLACIHIDRQKDRLTDITKERKEERQNEKKKKKKIRGD